MPKIQVTQIKSSAKKSERQKASLKGLGLGRIGKVSVLEETESVKGMVNAVKHLINSESVQ